MVAARGEFRLSSRFTYLLLCILLLIVSQCCVCSAQSCVAFKNETKHFCSDYVDYDYYFPAFPTVWIGEALLYGNSYSALLQSTFTAPDCQKGLFPFICAQTFPKCQMIDGVATARPVCEAQCVKVNKLCEEFNEFTATPPQDCSNFTTGDNCFELTTSLDAPPFPFECTYPMGYSKNAYPFPCGLQCPRPLYSEKFNNSIKWWIRIVEPIAAFSLIVFFCIMIYQRRFWFRYPIFYILYLTGGQLITHGSFLSATFKGSYSKIGCVDDATAATGELWLCNFTHWCLYLGMWINIICFAIIATNILILLLKVPLPKKLLSCFNHFIIFPAPVIIMIVVQSLGYAGSADGNGVCFFKPIPIGSETTGLVLLVVLVPFYTALAWGFLLLIITFVILIKKVGIRATFKQSRLALFALVYGSCLVLPLIVATQSATGKQLDKQIAYFGCLVNNWVQSQLSKHPQLEQCPLSEAQFNKFFWFYGNASGAVNSFLIIVFFSKYALQEARKRKKTVTPKVTF